MQTAPSVRRKITAVFLSGVGLGSTGLMAALIVSSLAAESISQGARWSGLPSALSILGTAAGTTILAGAMQRWGRRKGLLVSYIVAFSGAVATVVAVLLGSIGLLISGMFVIGLGRSGDSLSRYLVADLYPIERRASAIGWLVWVGTVGAVIGPNALGPAGRMAMRFDLPQLAGPFLVALAAYGAAFLLYLLFLRPDPSTLVVDDFHTSTDREREPLNRPFRLPTVRIAVAVLTVGQAAMVLIMTMTPIHLKESGHALEGVGVVMSAHIIGMFVFSPLTGRLVDRWGPRKVIVAGLIVLLLSALSAMLAPATDLPWMASALFLLGLGWNFGYVAGSALLGSGIPLDQRSRLQGRTDSLIWSAAALASALSGIVLASFGFQALCVLAGLLLLIPTAVLARYRPAIPASHP